MIISADKARKETDKTLKEFLKSEEWTNICDNINNEIQKAAQKGANETDIFVHNSLKSQIDYYTLYQFVIRTLENSGYTIINSPKNYGSYFEINISWYDRITVKGDKL